MNVDKNSDLVARVLGLPLAVGDALIERVICRQDFIGTAADYAWEVCKKVVPEVLQQQARSYITGFMEPYEKPTHRTGNFLAGRLY